MKACQQAHFMMLPQMNNGPFTHSIHLIMKVFVSQVEALSYSSQIHKIFPLKSLSVKCVSRSSVFTGLKKDVLVLVSFGVKSYHLTSNVCIPVRVRSCEETQRMCESFPGDENGSNVVGCADNRHVFVSNSGVDNQHPFSQNSQDIKSKMGPNRSIHSA